MTLEQLRIFLAVAEREHVTRAAEALNLTQSAVSAAVRALEARHGVALFHRVGRRIELTEAGRLFQGEATAVLARVQAAELVLSDLGGLRRGTLSVAASQTIASYPLPALLVRFRAAFPGIEVRVTAGNTTAVAQAVLDGAVELGFVEGGVDEPALFSTPIAQDRLALVVAPGHPWAGRESVGRDDLAHGDWVLREPGSGTRSAFEAALRGLGLDPGALRVTLELPSNEAVRAVVEAGGGASALSEHVVAVSLATGRLTRIGPLLPPRAFSMLRHRERYRSRAAEAFIDLIRSV
jgi:DNA-binding transcriptional LysR family regulator